MSYEAVAKAMRADREFRARFREEHVGKPALAALFEAERRYSEGSDVAPLKETIEAAFRAHPDLEADLKRHTAWVEFAK